MVVDVTILGAAGSHTGPGRPCSSYLLRCGGTQVLVDCGNGSSANLQLVTTPAELDAIVITHRHVDHCVDLIGMFYALRFHESGRRSVDLYAAPQVMDMLAGMLSEDSAMEFREVFSETTVHPGDRFEVGPFRFTAFPSTHPVPTNSLRVEVEGHVVAFSSDSSGGDQLVACARDADLFVCEATWQGDGDGLPDGIHLTARQAGQVATHAGVDRLLLTHILGSLDRHRSLAEARETFDGPLALAEELHTWTLT